MTDPEKIYKDEPIPLRKPQQRDEEDRASEYYIQTSSGLSKEDKTGTWNRGETDWDRFSLSFEKPAEKKEETPEKILELRRMMEPLDGYFVGRTEAFYTQAEFMKDYEDDYEFTGPFFHYYPTYQDMNVREMRGYFSWRTGFRQGNYPPAPLSFLFVYIYEIINGIGLTEPAEGFRLLQKLKEVYGEKEPSLLKYLSVWIQDYIVYWDLGEEYLKQCFQEERQLDRKLSVLENYREQTEEELFEAVRELSGHRIEKSPAFRKAPEDTAAVVARVYAAVSQYSENHHHGSLAERSFGRRDPVLYRMFHASVFYDAKKYSRRVCEIDPVRKYVCTDGRWSYAGYEVRTGRPRSSFLGEIIQETDRQLRAALGLKPALTEKLYRAAFKKIIGQTIEAYFKEKEEAKKTVVRIDREMLSGIRRDAAVTRDRLLTEEERTENSALLPEEWEETKTVTLPDVPAEETGGGILLLPPEEETPGENGYGLTQGEMEFLLALMKGQDVSEFARKRHLMLTVLVDSVNEKLYDEIGDTLLEMSGEVPEVIPDYLEDLRSILEDCGV